MSKWGRGGQRSGGRVEELKTMILEKRRERKSYREKSHSEKIKIKQ